MKRNALFRIILWSIVIAILTTAMVGVGFGISYNRNRRASRWEETTLQAATEVTAPYTVYGTNAVVTANAVNVRQSPSPESTIADVVYKEDRVFVTRTESVDSVRWAYITSPVTGWIREEYIRMMPDTDIGATSPDVEMSQTQETMVSGNSGGKDTFDASVIRELEIEWAAGDILIQPGTSDRIVVKEDGVSEDRYAMYLYQDGDTLKIRYAQSVKNFIGLNDLMEKDLTIYVPVDWHCASLDINAATATVEVNDLNIGEVDFEGASGTCEFENCTVNEIDIDTASGDVRFVGSLNILDCDAASASVFASLINVPSRLNMDMMSGDLELVLPADAGFSLQMDTMRDNFHSEFQTELKYGNYVAGDGACRINIDALSGAVTIRKAM